MDAHEQTVYDTLRSLGVAYEVRRHAPAHTMTDCLSLGLAPDVAYCKNLFLCNRQQTHFYLLLALPDKAFRTADVSKQLGVSRLSFAPEWLLPDYLGLLAGAVSPFGLLFDPQARVRLLVDADLARDERVAFHPCVNTATVVLSMRDFFDVFLPHTQHVPTTVFLPPALESASEVCIK